MSWGNTEDLQKIFRPRRKRWATLNFRYKIRNILLLYYLTPVVLIFVAAAILFYSSTKKSLDEELGNRLTSVAIAAASHVRDYHLLALNLKNPTNRTYQTLFKRFQALQEANHVEKIYLFNENNESLLDTDPSFSLGAIYPRNRLNAAELRLSKKGQPISSVLFQGRNGAFYKSAFAPVQENGTTLALVGVDGNASFFKNLHLLSRQLAYFALTCVVLIVLISIILSRKIVAPIHLLVHSAQKIGEGNLTDPVKISSKNELGFLAYVLDEMRKNIVVRDRELQVMLRGIAHEVRNPLGGIELFAGILEEELKEPRQRDAVLRIQHEIKTLKNLVEEFLDFAKGPTLETIPVQVDSFLQEIKTAFQKECVQRGVEFKVQSNGLKEGWFDPDQMKRAMLNVIQNSLQALPPQGGKIQVDAIKVNRHLEFSVQDSGSGISPDRIEKIFDPFYTTKERGTGLGLSFVRKIVNAHGGDIRIESKPGNGTLMTLVLPEM